MRPVRGRASARRSLLPASAEEGAVTGSGPERALGVLAESADVFSLEIARNRRGREPGPVEPCQPRRRFRPRESRPGRRRWQLTSSEGSPSAAPERAENPFLQPAHAASVGSDPETPDRSSRSARTKLLESPCCPGRRRRTGRRRIGRAPPVSRATGILAGLNHRENRVLRESLAGLPDLMRVLGQRLAGIEACADGLAAQRQRSPPAASRIRRAPAFRVVFMESDPFYDGRAPRRGPDREGFELTEDLEPLSDLEEGLDRLVQVGPGWPAETWQRSRACPCGTTGNPNPET